VIAHYIEETHIQLTDEVFQFIALFPDGLFRGLLAALPSCASFHQIAHADGKFGSQKVERLHGLPEKAFSFASAPVADDGEVEVFRRIQKRFVGIGQDFPLGRRRVFAEIIHGHSYGSFPVKCFS